MQLKTYSFKISYIIIHALYTYFEFLYSVWVYLFKRVLLIYRTVRSLDDWEYVREQANRLEKIPTHITILLGNEEPSYQDLANLVMWSVASGTTFVSLYDHKGILKKTEDKLQKVIERRKHKDVHILWYNGENTYKNGFVGQKLYIRTLSLENGQLCIAETTKKFCNNMQDFKITQNAVDKHLRNNFVFPDPELALFCGSICSVYGYPPWQIRVTEFLSIGSHHSISSKTFVETLSTYSKTEQRLGK